MNLKDNSKDYLLYQKYLELKGVFDTNPNLDYWSNIPISSVSLSPLYTVYQPDFKLLDLGCGAGNVLRFAKNIGYKVFGVEFNVELLKYLGDYNYLYQDIKELNKKFFSEFDVIYSYKPLKKEFKDYIDIIINNMKFGSYIMTPTFKIKNKSLINIEQDLYKKIK